MSICEAGPRRNGPFVCEVLRGAGERNSFELLMINPRLNNWKPKKGWFGKYLTSSSTRPHLLNENRNGDHGNSFHDAGAGNGDNGSLAAAEPWRATEDNG